MEKGDTNYFQNQVIDRRLEGMRPGTLILKAKWKNIVFDEDV